VIATGFGRDLHSGRIEARSTEASEVTEVQFCTVAGFLPSRIRVNPDQASLEQPGRWQPGRLQRGKATDFSGALKLFGRLYRICS